MFHQQCCAKIDMKGALGCHQSILLPKAGPLSFLINKFSVLILQLCSDRDATASLGDVLHTSPYSWFFMKLGLSFLYSDFSALGLVLS